VRLWWPYLDLARGVAALLVAISHLRAFSFVDFHQADHPRLIWSCFYFLTGFGHQAVMVFFVLSGFLVGGTVVSRAHTRSMVLARLHYHANDTPMGGSSARAPVDSILG
jgi:peptidoglycan/LPS O-acetylase OafA/YrhL